AVSKRRTILAALPDPRARFLESLPKLDVPEPPFDRCERFVVVVLESSGHKRRIEIEYILHPQRQRRAIYPGPPSTRVVLSRGDRYHVFRFAVLHPDILTTIL